MSGTTYTGIPQDRAFSSGLKVLLRYDHSCIVIIGDKIETECVCVWGGLLHIGQTNLFREASRFNVGIFLNFDFSPVKINGKWSVMTFEMPEQGMGAYDVSIAYSSPHSFRGGGYIRWTYAIKFLP